MEHFPDDVLIDIFLRLPVISILVSKSVCKRWLRIIQNPNFIGLHFNRPINNSNDNNSLLVMRTLRFRNTKLEKIVFTMGSNDKTQYSGKNMPLKLLSPSMASRIHQLSEVRLTGPCNGLFCITDKIDLVIFNPATRQYRNVPRNSHSVLPKELPCYFEICGFGFDPVSNDYKVANFVELHYHDCEYDCDDVEEEEEEEHNYEVPLGVEIFSLSTNSWREFKCDVPLGKILHLSSYSLFCNGAFHWLRNTYDQEEGGDSTDILVFDLNEEKFKMFVMPATCTEIETTHVYLAVLNECLTVIVHTELNYADYSADDDADDDVDYDSEYYEIQIWAMMKYGDDSSWEKLNNLSDVKEVNRPLSFSNNGKLFVETPDDQLASIDLITGKMEKFIFNEVQKSVDAFSYRESLISPN